MKNVRSFHQFVNESHFDEEGLRKGIKEIFNGTLKTIKGQYYIQNKEQAAREISQLIGNVDMQEDILVCLENELVSPKGQYYISGEDEAIECIIGILKGGKPVRNGSFLATEPSGEFCPPEPEYPGKLVWSNYHGKDVPEDREDYYKWLRSTSGAPDRFRGL